MLVLLDALNRGRVRVSHDCKRPSTSIYCLTTIDPLQRPLGPGYELCVRRWVRTSKEKEKGSASNSTSPNSTSPTSPRGDTCDTCSAYLPGIWTSLRICSTCWPGGSMMEIWPALALHWPLALTLTLMSCLISDVTPVCDPHDAPARGNKETLRRDLRQTRRDSRGSSGSERLRDLFTRGRGQRGRPSRSNSRGERAALTFLVIRKFATS